MWDGTIISIETVVSRNSLWVGTDISIYSVAVTDLNDSDSLFYLLPGNFFRASKAANLRAVTGNVFKSYLRHTRYIYEEKHTHMHMLQFTGNLLKANTERG